MEPNDVTFCKVRTSRQSNNQTKHINELIEHKAVRKSKVKRIIRTK